MMKRLPRSASTLGAVDFADALTRELRIKLDELPGRFSFDAATEAAQQNQRLMYGRRTENMFEYVVASLGRAVLITREDSGDVTSTDGDVQAPDYFVALKDGSRCLVEVKNRRLKDFQTPVILNHAYLSRLNRYAALKGYPLMIAVYWSNLRQWTINKASEIVGANGSISLSFVDAMRLNQAAAFGDRLIMAIPPLRCRFWADPLKPRTVADDGLVNFTIGKVTFHTSDAEILDAKERELALYFMFHSSWAERACTASTKDGVLEYVEFESGPEDDETTPEQPMCSLGTLAGMISNYYNWLTVAEDRKLVRLTPNAQPGSLASGLEDGFRGTVLKLWIFSIEPNMTGTLRAS
jgi:hypothetical protein